MNTKKPLQFPLRSLKMDVEGDYSGHFLLCRFSRVGLVLNKLL